MSLQRFLTLAIPCTSVLEPNLCIHEEGKSVCNNKSDIEGRSLVSVQVRQLPGALTQVTILDLLTCLTSLASCSLKFMHMQPTQLQSLLVALWLPGFWSPRSP